MVVRIYMDSRWEVDTYTVEGVFNPYSGDDELRSLDLVNVPELAMAQP
jgi:hypothetical protein